MPSPVLAFGRREGQPPPEADRHYGRNIPRGQPDLAVDPAANTLGLGTRSF